MDERPMDQHDPDDSALEVGTREVYRESLDGIDAATRSRLTQARHRALEALPKRRATALRWLPAGAVAAAVVMAWMLVGSGPSGISQPEMLEIEILMAEDELEMFEEFEFYAWIDELEELQGGFLEDGVG
jgi:hypothetical protein